MINFKFLKKIQNKLFPFYKNRDLKYVLKKLEEISNNQSKSAMFVGGCVRKHLQNQSVDDIDIATSATTNQIREKFKNTKFKIIDSGIKHGTITLISQNSKIELTTLRKDVTTYGRHADVEFTDDWKEDSQRRDITINAIYLDKNGKIYDFHNGVKDLKKKIVKFIGDPEKRIQEDYLRIIRFIRFAIQYDSSTDSDTIKALKLNLNGIKDLSKERIFDELIKILRLENFDDILKHENKKNIFLLIFPEFKNIEKMNKLKHCRKLNYFVDESVILAVLLFESQNNYEYFCYKYKTSNKLNKKLTLLFKLYEKIKSNKNFFKKDLIKNVYLYGSKNIKDTAIIDFFEKSQINLNDFRKLISEIQKIKIPIFKYDGEYLKKKGMREGALIGRTLKLIEKEWINNKFQISDQTVDKIVKSQKN